jgi:hypothetical protein
MTDMETKELYLYKLSKSGFGAPAYVVAANQQEAVNKKGQSFDTDVNTITVEYVGVVTV